MESLFPTLVLILLALLGARVSFSTSRARLGAQLLLRTGTLFVGVGFALGPSALGLLTPDAIDALLPLLAVGLGWVGLHFGLQLDSGSLRRFPPGYYAFALVQAALSLVIFGVIGLAAVRISGLDGPVPLLLVLCAACTASVTTPAGIALVSTTFGVKGHVRDLLFFAGSIDAIVGIAALQLTYSLFRPGATSAGFGPPSQLLFVPLALGVGLVCGIVFLWLARSKPGGEELVLYLLGSCAFASGVALQWGLSPLFVSTTMGAVVANLSKSRARIHAVLTRWEKPVYVTFLLLAGALLRVPTWLVFPLALGYMGLRSLSKLGGAVVPARALDLGFDAPWSVGLGLIPQGGISIAMAVSGMLMYSDLQVRGLDAEAALFAIIVLGVALSELLGPLLTLRVLRRAGEIVSPALAQQRAGSLDR
jgi:hypothetical protein